MLLSDQAALVAHPPNYQVFASDIDEHAIAVTPARLRQHFTRDENRHQIRKAVRDRILFAVHNLPRHPLNLIHVNVELLARLPELRQLPAVARSAGVIRNAVPSQAKLIDDLLDMSRVRTGKLTLSMAPLDLVPLARDAVRAGPGGGDLAIGVELDDGLPRVTADSVRIEQVVMNLLNNAVKFTPPGGAVRVALARDGDAARIDVVGKPLSVERLMGIIRDLPPARQAAQ